MTKYHKIQTTTIGSYPKPDDVPTPDWFRADTTLSEEVVGKYNEYLKEKDQSIESLLDEAVENVVREQVRAGIDIPTDGEVRREHYINYHCRHLDGIDFEKLTKKTMRAGTWIGKVPTIYKKIGAKRTHFLTRDYKIAQSATRKPVKITLPGPMTIADSMYDNYYGDEKKLGKDLAEALNYEIKALTRAGCDWIQIDEPVFARYPEKVLTFGIENLERCFYDVPKRINQCMHMCCGYPDKLDNINYPKADPRSYHEIAEAVDSSSIQFISIEDAHRYNDITLFDKFKKSTVVLGLVTIAQSRVETKNEIRMRVKKVLEHIDKERLMAAPDCGLGMLPRNIAVAKMENLAKAVNDL
jgi:5-methyltetrahydropteroyltriglutamate--homocysteine methyltransferase